MKEKNQVSNRDEAREVQALDRQEDSFFQDIINRHFEFIEKQCFKAVGIRQKVISIAGPPIEMENEALELCNRVLDKLKQNGYRVLKQFKGNCKWSTYLAAVIAHQGVELIRKKKGRSREKERARALGEVGERIYRLAVVEGLPAAEVHRRLTSADGFSVSTAEVDAMIEKIRGKRLNPGPLPVEGNPAVKEGSRVDGDGEPVVANGRGNPEEIYLEEQRKQRASRVIGEAVSRLRGEERLVLRMRFPADEDEGPRSVDQISKVLGISRKAVYKRIDRILKKCKRQLEQAGVRIDDLL